jgi:hypothetical protein
MSNNQSFSGHDAPTTPRELTFGEKAVGLTFNPGNNYVVNEIKGIFADIIDSMNNRMMASDSPELQRICSIAIAEAQSAQMWAVKAITWQY